MRRATVLLLLLSIAMSSYADEYRESVEEWFQGRLDRLTAVDGYLSLVGLFRLAEGENRIGSAADNDFVFPEKAPAQVGTVTVTNGKGVFRAADGVVATVDGEVVTEIALATDHEEHTTKVVVGELSFFMMERPGNQLLLRLKDTESPLRKAFEGDIDRFPVDPKWRVKARWIPYDPPVTREFANVLGAVEELELTGYLEFELEGETYTLDPQIDTEADDLFIIIADETTGKETYGGGRYIHIPYADENGETWLDFNHAYNPPCAFSPYSTCQYPSKENRLPLAITAGELTYTGKLATH